MEYAFTSWDPYKVEDVNCLDKVQRRAAHHACNNYTERTAGCVATMNSSQGWESLQDRQKIHCLTILFKIKHNLVEIPVPMTVEHEYHRGFLSLYTNVTVYKMSFFPRTIQDWNKLPSTTTNVQTIKAFKAALHTSVAVSVTSHGCT